MIEVCRWGGSDYNAPAETTVGFPTAVAETLVADFSYLTNVPKEAMLRFTPAEGGYVLSAIRSEVVERRACVMTVSYFMDEEMADELLGISWVGLTQRIEERLLPYPLEEQRYLLRENGWSFVKGKEEQVQLSYHLRNGFLFGACLASKPELTAKVGYCLPFFETAVTALLSLLPISLRRQLSFCGPCSHISHADGVCLYFMPQSNEETLYRSGGVCRDRATCIECGPQGVRPSSALLGQKKLQKLQDDMQILFDGTEEEWEWWCTLLGEDISWDGLLNVARYTKNIPEALIDLMELCSTDGMRQLIRDLTDAELKKLSRNKKLCKALQKNEPIWEAIQKRQGSEVPRRTYQGELYHDGQSYHVKTQDVCAPQKEKTERPRRRSKWRYLVRVLRAVAVGALLFMVTKWAYLGDGLGERVIVISTDALRAIVCSVLWTVAAYFVGRRIGKKKTKETPK